MMLLRLADEYDLLAAASAALTPEEQPTPAKGVSNATVPGLVDIPPGDSRYLTIGEVCDVLACAQER
jgi:hypothetical protein